MDERDDQALGEITRSYDVELNVDAVLGRIEHRKDSLARANVVELSMKRVPRDELRGRRLIEAPVEWVALRPKPNELRGLFRLGREAAESTFQSLLGRHDVDPFRSARLRSRAS